ncbi:MAG: FecR domain-containing protein, partial [Alphaproteobacteria bacterium]|nr:FecR domain-containing protein [Alphaproteobacteria bacterium]
MGREAGSRRETIRLEAAQWVVQLDAAACRPADRAAFEAWRDQGVDYEVAFERELAAWERLDRLRALAPDVAAPRVGLLTPPRAASWRTGVWARAAAVVGAGGMVAAGVISATASTAYATGIGERRVIVLSDDSRIQLNTNSKVLVRYRGGVREIRLVRGEAVFEPVRAARPFVVRAAGSRLQASGAALIAVRLQDDSAAITVRDGTVVVKRDHAAAQTQLSAGAEAIYGPVGGRVLRVSTAEIDRSLAWRQGAIALNGQTLEQAVAEFNRYNRQRITVDGASVSGLRLAGYFQSTEPEGFVSAVT